ncbi:Pfs, NACHT and WD domain protein [Trichoderma chlorosporum]
MSQIYWMPDIIIERDLRSTDPRDDKIRIEQTKGGLLRELYSWIIEKDKFKLWYDDDDTQGQLLWITGDLGKGKTMLACGIIDELANQTRIRIPESKTILSYFFCQGTDSRINTAVGVLRSLLYLIIHQQPSLISHLKSKYDVAGKSLFEDVNAWTALSLIFVKVLQDTSKDNMILVIDALDECEADRVKLLDFILQHSSLPRVEWIITSRNGLNMEQKMSTHNSQTLLSLELKENEACISHAVNTYIKHSVSQLDLVQGGEVRQDDLEKAMRQKVNGTFLWVSLVMKELQQVESWDALQVINEIPSDLKDVYARMLKQILQLKRGNAVYCMQLLSTVCASYRPLSLSELGSLSDLPRGISEKPGAIRRAITMCGSFLTVRGENVYLVHQSAKDYLSTEALQTIFPSGVEKIHHRDLKAPGVLIDEAMAPDPDPLATTRYSCVYWVDHLCDSISESWTQINDLEDNGAIHQFLENKFLFWLEALSLLRNVSSSIAALNKLKALTTIRDARRFILAHWKMIEVAPLQLYVSALLFSPTNSIIRRLFINEVSKWIASKPEMNAKWDSCIQILKGHQDEISQVIYSADGQRLATASRDKTVKIWDYNTGVCLLTLHGHSGKVRLVVFSVDCRKVVSACDDGIVKVWDARGGNCLQSIDCIYRYFLRWHQRPVTLSSDGKLAAALSFKNSLTIWDLAGTYVGTHQPKSAIAFSPNGQQFASYTEMLGNVKIWNIETGETIKILMGDVFKSVSSVAFSPDGLRIASCYTDSSTVNIWDAVTGNCLQTIYIVRYLPSSVAFSANSRELASASRQGVVEIWDLDTWNTSSLRRNFSSRINQIRFSEDNSSTTSFDACNIWETTTGECLQIPYDTGFENFPACSPDSKKIAIATPEISSTRVEIWDITTKKRLKTLETLDTRKMFFSPNGKLLGTVEESSLYTPSLWILKSWDVEKGSCLQTFQDVGDVEMCAYSSDNQIMADPSAIKKINIWDVATGACLIELDVGPPIDRLSFDSLNNSRIHTNLGVMDLNFGSSKTQNKPSSRELVYHGYGISLDGMWILNGKERLHWLPLDYRNKAMAVQGSQIAIDAVSPESKRLFLINFINR